MKKPESIKIENEKKLFEQLLIIAGVFVFVILWYLTKTPGTDGYFKANYALFFICLVTVMLMIIRRNDYMEIVSSFNSMLTKNSEDSYRQKSNVVFGFIAILSIVSILFLIDLNFFNNIGIRIGAVAAVGLSRIVYFTLKS